MTKQLMKDSLLELMETKDLANITVTAVCDTADIHRSTFYKYYSDPSDLLRDIEMDLLNRIPFPQLPVEKDQEKLLEMNAAFFDFVKENDKAFRILFNDANGSSFSARMVDFLCSGYLPVSESYNETDARFTRLYIANGCIGMLREWINDDFPISSQKIAAMMFNLSRKLSE